MPTTPLAPLPPPARTHRRLIIGVAVVVLFAIGGTAAWFLTRKHGPSYPKAWDPRVEPLVKEAEKLRQLKFEHPVYVEFLTPAEYTKKSTGDDGEDGGGESAEEKEGMNDSVAALRAMGLINGKLDLEEAGKTLADSGTLAFYSFTDKRVYIRGTKMTVDLKVTLVHELTHVLQDQHFDLSKVNKAVDDMNGDPIAVRALVEGDAEDVENQYIDSLSKHDRDAYNEEEAKQSDDEGTKKVLKLPPVLLQVFGAPYSFGPTFIKILKQTGGENAINDAFARPPTTFAEIWNPFLYLDHQTYTKVDSIKAPKGAKAIDDSPMGSFVIYLVLAQRMDPLDALDAADLWRGDSSTTYKQDGKVCVALHMVGAEHKDQGKLMQAWKDWADSMPKGAASVKPFESDGVAVTSCDPGPKAKIGVADSVDAILSYPLTRVQIAQQILEDPNGGDFHVSPPAAECYGNAVVHMLPRGAITGADPDWQPSSRQRAKIQGELMTCVQTHP